MHRPGTALYPYIRRLKHDAIPSVFSNYPESLELNESNLGKEKLPTSVINVPECSNEPGQSFQDPLVYSNELNELTLQVEEQIEHDYRYRKKDILIEKLQRQIFVLKRQVNRKDKKIERMKALILYLQKKRLDDFRRNFQRYNKMYFFSHQSRLKSAAAHR